MAKDASGRDWVMALPSLGRLIWRLVRDDRVPLGVRGGLVAVGAYIAMPFDIIPDWLPFAGQIDDLLVATLGVRTLLRMVKPEVLVECWPGDPAMLERLVGRELSSGVPPTA